MVQHSQPYITPGKTIALTVQTFVYKVLFLHFNMLSKYVIAFLPTSKHLLISCLQSPSAVILEPTKVKFVSVSSDMQMTTLMAESEEELKRLDKSEKVG